MLHPHPYLWCLCRTEHELPLPSIYFAQRQTAGFSVVLQLLLLSLLHILMGSRVMFCARVMTVTVVLEEVMDIVSYSYHFHTLHSL